MTGCDLIGITGLDHIGYAVKNLDSARKIFESLGFTFTPAYEDRTRNVNISFGKFMNKNNTQSTLERGGGDCSVELLSPIEGTKSPVDGYLKKIGSAPYHICLRVSNMAGVIEKLQEKGFMVVVPSAPAPAIASNASVCFLYLQDIGLIELVEHSDSDSDSDS